MPVVVAGIALIVLLAVFVSYGSSQITKSWGGGFLSWFEEQVVSTAVGGTWVASQVLKLTRYLTHSLGTHFASIEHQGVMFLSGLAQYVKLMGKATLLWPFELSNALYWLVRHEIPHLVKSLPNSVTRVVHSTVTRVVRVERTVVRFPKLTRAQVRAAIAAVLPAPILSALPLVRWLRDHYRALQHAVAATAGALVHPGTLAHDVTVPFGRTVAQIRKLLRRFHWLLAFGSAAGLVTAALARLGLGWVRCSNVAKAGKALCRANVKWLENLLLGTLAIFGTLSLRTFAVLVYELTDDAARQTQRFWRSEVSGLAPNPGLGDIGGPSAALRPAGYESPSPGLGDAA